MVDYHFDIFADYFQFYVQDEQAQLNTSTNIWAGEAVPNLLTLQPGFLGIGTVRNATVPVTIEFHEALPNDDFALWDHVNECSLEVKSGTLVVMGCTDYWPDAARIQVDCGSYRARIYYGGLFTLRGNGLEGDDHYKVVLWRGVAQEMKVLKRTAPTYS